jgi:hypothetical protein
MTSEAGAGGLDLDDWDPADGFEVNRETVLAVYDYYLDLHRLDDCLQ